MRLRHLALPLFLACLAGCTMIPEYERPEAPVPPTWPDESAYQATDEEAGERAVATIGWRDFFAEDPILTELVKRALTQNRDLRVAVLDVQRARAQYRIQRSELLPELDVNANYSNQQTPATVFGAEAQSLSIENYELNVGLTSYELDLFGRVRSLEEQALQEYLSTFEARRSAQIGLIAELASAYLTFRADRTQQQLARQTLKNRRESLALAQRRFDNGVASELELNQARTAVERARTELHRLRRFVAQDRNALRLLVAGELPPALGEQQGFDEVSLDLPLPAELESALLLRRPDVRQAEHQLMAANANIGAARAAFFPRITLTGSYGRLSPRFSDMFEGSLTGSVYEAWNFVPQISVPIFDGGRREAQLDVAKLRKRQEIARYERTIAQAFREVADALAARGTLDEQLSSQQSLVEATRKSYQLSRLRYEQGIASFLAVLDAQRELFSARQSLIEVRRAILANEIALYRTLGGGWSEETAAAQTAASGD